MMDAKPFGVVVRDLLIERGFVTGLGNPNWASFAQELPEVHYETLRKAVTGDRAPGERLMEQIAEALKVPPTVFYEYGLIEAQRQFDPKVVGNEQALANLQAWNEARPRRVRSKTAAAPSAARRAR